MRIQLKNILHVSVMLLIGIAGKAQTAPDNTKYVNTFVGTEAVTDYKLLGYVPPKNWRPWSGLTFPGSSLPNAMVQVSPMTKYQPAGAGYEYEDSVIVSFTHTNKGHWNFGNVPVLPMSKPGETIGSRFSHKNESSSPGYYQVYLADYGINVQLTSTLRCAYYRFDYKSDNDRQVLFDLSKALSGVTDWEINQDGDYAVKGKQGGENIFFYAVFSSKIADLVNNHGTTTKNVRGREVNAPSGNAIIHLVDDGKEPVYLKIGFSFVSTDNARMNLDKEIANKSFETVRKDAHAAWQKLLSTIQVKGGTEKQKTMLYSCLYRSFLWPVLRSDVNGDFTDINHKVVNTGIDYYTEPSLWDTYRNKDVLLELVSPNVTLNVIKSLEDKGDKTGYIPTFFHGDHGASSIAGAYLRGIDGFDIKDTYRILLNNANLPPAGQRSGGRQYLDEYLKKGYISDPEIQNATETAKGRAGVSKTLEYSYDDYSIAQIAKKLGDTANYRILMARSKNYKNVFDKSTNFMRGRTEDGGWIQNFNPQYPYYEWQFREANAWQVSFFAPHDMPGLIALYGGPKPFEAKLDSFFTTPWNPHYIARNVETFIGQYCQGNQPDHEAPFSYTLIGKPAKTQKVLDNIMNNLYGMGPRGIQLAGMDDAGEMSAWFVFSSLGLYPLSPTDPKYIVTAPLFDEVKWRTSNGKYITISKPGKGRAITAIKVNGKLNKDYYVSHDLFKNGGNVLIATK
ncbi:GH92 family glycosyl hydrolase [Mucilaginibacter ximonensis]|uniref:GH92 family glycosyl hydrolase n=1 Tax=Mucilaginibacter ximonensis TaxID=538021 RepID=A0ABW5YAK0_9SPHI